MRVSLRGGPNGAETGIRRYIDRVDGGEEAMEAVILAGGLGSRLWPLTARRPKHLLPVAGVPFLLHQITKLAAAGVDHIVVATSYRAADFEPILGDGSAL